MFISIYELPLLADFAVFNLINPLNISFFKKSNYRQYKTKISFYKQKINSKTVTGFIQVKLFKQYHCPVRL
ncbi:hypothetical protein MNV_700026 [Candidatus Methanoperedens nitroreducens]|uniref:Uncharacterized protein n=1 Tax=Candidatus Methanoperedens nitratireducens TaxID=1392998 RepID=A0A284VSX6_9EURY|nr:hypothetical protein MNV_700026 [Candidatus Methanoperedens nitroreducens]